MTLALVAAVAAWLLAPPPSYSVRTLIRIPPGPFLLRPGMEPAIDPVIDLASHQRNQIALAKSRRVLNTALRDPKVAGLALITSTIEPVAWLEKEVRVDFSIAPEIMQISMKGQHPQDLEVLVNALRKAFLTEVVDRDRSTRRQRFSFLGEQIQKYEDRLKQARDTQKEIEKQFGGAGADFRGRLLLFTQQQLGMAEKELLTTQSQLRKARVDLTILQGRPEKGGPEAKVSDQAVAEALDKVPAIREARAEIRELEGRIKQTLERSSGGKEDPAVLRDEKKISNLKQKIAEISAKMRPEIVKQVAETAALDLQAAIADKKERIEALEMMAKVLEPEVDRLRKSVVDMGQNGVKLGNFTEDIGHIEELTKKLKLEHETLRIELDAPSRITELEEATVSRVAPEAREWVPTGGAALAAVGFALVGIVGSRRPRASRSGDARPSGQGGQP